MDQTQKPNQKTLQAFRELLSDSGYIHYYLAFGNGNMRQQEWGDYASNLPTQVQALVKLFLLNQWLEITAVSELLGKDVYQLLLSFEILTTKDNFTFTDDYVLVCVNSIWLFCQINSHLAPPSVYFGSDSVALSHYHIPQYGGKSLDLCAGSAIQAMNIARHTQHEVDAVEINPRAIMMARFNLYLNHLDERVKLFNLSAEEYAQQNHNQYSLIVFNPPFVPVPQSHQFPFVGNGGPDGLGMVKTILNLYLPKLAEGGTVEFLGFVPGLNGNPTFIGEFEKILAQHPGYSGHITLVTKFRLQPNNQLYDNMVLRTALNTKILVAAAYEALTEHFRAIHANEVYLYFCRIRKNTKQPSDSQLTVINLARELYLGEIIRSTIWQLPV
ncbi:hypothetical protein THII_2795 [Thioploca ingrica]|uniref:Methyltransferase small domain-containing protein n=1 Tax=Thioploca ingrica TaxID=40754 RepID=A0A090AMB8_9GAMM|nr:hypothetical protein THII_2795 [Thioploca ingrica]